MQLYGQEHLLRGSPWILIYDNDKLPRLYAAMAGHLEADHLEPLIHACYWGLEIVVQRFLKSNARLITPSRLDNPLHAASFSGHHRIVKMLLDRGAAVDGRVGASPALTWTVPLHAAVRNGHIEAVRTLL